MKTTTPIYSLLLAFLWMTSYPILAQEPDSTQYLSIRSSYGYGYIFPTQDFLKFDNATGSQIHETTSFGADFTWRVSGKKEWHHLYKMPRFGFGVRQHYFPEELGRPLSVYGLYEQSLAQNAKNALDWGVHLGLTTGWNAFDTVNNPNNTLLGLETSVYIHFRLMYTRQLAKHWSTFAVLGVTHGSNGALKMPNFGINVLDPRVGIQYHFAPKKPRPFYPYRKQEFTPSNVYSFVVAAGTKQIEFINNDPEIRDTFYGKNYTMYNGVLTYERQFSRRSRFGGGIDVTYDESANAKGLVDGDTTSTFPAPLNEKIKLSLLLSYQVTMGKLDLVLQPGYYIYRTTHDPTPAFYQRIGLRYDVYKGILVGTTLRAVNFGQADWIEWSIGYALKK